MWMYVEGAFDGANKGPFRLCRQGPTYVRIDAQILGPVCLEVFIHSGEEPNNLPTFLPASHRPSKRAVGSR